MMFEKYTCRQVDEDHDEPMEASVITPGQNQSVIALSDGHKYHDHDHDLDELIVSEQAAYGRRQCEDAQTIARDVKQAQHDLLQSGAMFAVASADRIARNFADLTEAVYESNIRNLNRMRDLEVKLLETEAKTQRQMLKGHAAIELRSAEQFAELQATIVAEGTKSREQAADFRMRDLEKEVHLLKYQLINKP